MDFAAARVKMVDNQIRTTDVTSHELLRAFLTVARERFVPDARKSLAYIDEDLPLGVAGRYLMEPSPLAKLLQMAAILPDDTVLDVGCGTGYGAAVMAQVGSHVVALEEDETLAETARSALQEIGIANAEVVTGPLTAGHAAGAPYDVIVLEGAVDEVPDVFFEQLRDRGRLVTVVGSGLSAMAKLYTKEDGIVSDRFGFNCSLKPLPGFRRERGFVF
jgi:protein-L-isoaspartate(D-aspartate) O-methyltransferase